MGNSLIDKIAEETMIRFMDENKNPIELKASEIYKAYCPAKATPEQLIEFKMKVEALGLDPRRSQVWMSIFDEHENGKKVGEKVVILTSYQVYLSRAQASGKLAGHHVVIEKNGSENPLMWEAKFVGKRTDMEQEYETPFIPVQELSKKRGLWNIMPTIMTNIRMESLGMRWMMADVLGGMPYTAEEIQSGASEADINALQQVENQEEIEKEKQDAEQKKQSALVDIYTKIDACKTLAELDKWLAKNEAKLNESIMKEPIYSYINSIRYEMVLRIIAEKISYAYEDISEYMNPEIYKSEFLKEVLGGNKDAINQFASDVSTFLSAKSAEPEEMELPELGDGEKEHNPPA